MAAVAPDPIAILSKRQLPGVVLLDRAGEIIWRSRQAATLMTALSSSQEDGPAMSMVDTVVALAKRSLSLLDGETDAPMAVFADGDTLYGLRADLLHSEADWPLGAPPPEGGAGTMVMVWMDQVSLAREVDFDAVRRRYGISRREQDVLRMLYHGKGNREIAALLFISEHTVKDHIKAILAKMEVTSRSQVVYKLTTA